MARVAVNKGERLQVRLDARAKRKLERAAGYRQETISQFVLETALKEAEKVVREREAIALSEDDWTLFFEALTSPPRPNAALRKAFVKHRKSLA